MEHSRKTIVMVDDNITSLHVARNTLMEKYDIFTVPSGKKLFQLLDVKTPDLILLDVDMPETNGYEVIKKLKSTESSASIPVIFLTAMMNVEEEIMGLSLGAIDYIAKPFSDPLLLKRIELHLLVEEQKKELMLYNTELQGMVHKRTKTVLELQNVVLKTVAELVEFRDDITGKHIERTQNYLHILVRNLLQHSIYADEISSWDINLLLLSSQLHDVGKIAIRDSILLKPAKLTAEEFAEIKQHTIIGANIIKKISMKTEESAFLRQAEIFALSHHEKWDGTGYPAGLRGEEIPLQGRLMAIVDVYDALTNDRPYKKAFSHEEALAIIESEVGTHFDPIVASEFLRLAKEIKKPVPGIGIFSDMVSKKTENDYELQRAFSRTLEEIKNYRDGNCTKNSQVDRISSYMMILLNALLRHEKYSKQVSSWDKDLFTLSSQLHDVGKMAVHDEILHKTQSLTENEFERMKEHTDYGVRIVSTVGNDIADEGFSEHAEAMAVSHHERWDGTGYPAGLVGEAIPLQGRLMAIIDTYDAMTSDRPYKKASSHEEALAAIKNGSGTCFDPRLVMIFLEREKEFKAIQAAVQRAI